MGLRGFGPRSIPGKDHGGRRCGRDNGQCRVCASAGDVWVRLAGGDGDEYVGQIGGFSHESEHDLALMVSDFLENGSGGTDARWCSSDSDSGLPDLSHLAEKITFYKRTIDQHEIDLLAVVRSLLLSISESELQIVKDGQCNASCIRKLLAKLLRTSGYDASVCISKWQGSDKLPGGDHEYIDVVVDNDATGLERLIIDIDFRSHFEIARAVESYDAILETLPVVFVGTWNRLKQLLQVMADAAKSSLKQNSMPLPPWRSLPYLQAKWHSSYERILSPVVHYSLTARFLDHEQCVGHLRRLKSALQTEIEAERLLKPIINDKKWRVKPERRKRSLRKV